MQELSISPVAYGRLLSNKGRFAIAGSTSVMLKYAGTVITTVKPLFGSYP